MGPHEQKRAMILTRLIAGQWTQHQAAEALGLSVRQVRRLQVAYEQKGVQALVHGNRGRVSPQALAPDVRETIVRLAQTTYAACNDQHLTELLAERDGLHVSRATVQRLRRGAGLPSPRRHRPPAHRQRRERRPQAGMLLQADGSAHAWLGDRGPRLTLVGAIDDATGQVPWALFREQEDAHGYFLVLREISQLQGLPHAWYCDRHSIFLRAPQEAETLAEQLAGQRGLTQFGRALTELGIQPIYAQSPQAKGRIERLWGTWQDRLTVELALAGATTLAEANDLLWAWLPRFNARFAVLPLDPTPAWRPWPAGLDPAQVFCFKYRRVVAADNTVPFAGQVLQVLPGPDRLSYAKARVEVHERLDGSLAVYYQGRCLATRPAPPSTPVLRARAGPRVPAVAPAEPPPAPAGALADPAPTPRATAPALASPLPAGPAPTGPAPPRPLPAPDHPWRRPYQQKNERPV